MYIYPVINGRAMEQCLCDKCNRTVYMKETKYQMRYRLRSYSKAERLDAIENTKLIGISIIWNDEKQKHYCRGCYDNNYNRVAWCSYEETGTLDESIISVVI